MKFGNSFWIRPGQDSVEVDIYARNLGFIGTPGVFRLGSSICFVVSKTTSQSFLDFIKVEIGLGNGNLDGILFGGKVTEPQVLGGVIKDSSDRKLEGLSLNLLAVPEVFERRISDAYQTVWLIDNYSAILSRELTIFSINEGTVASFKVYYSYLVKISKSLLEYIKSEASVEIIHEYC